jgi:hypothetical protein
VRKIRGQVSTFNKMNRRRQTLAVRGAQYYFCKEALICSPI